MKAPYTIDLDQKPVRLSESRFWQFCSGSHSSARQEVLCSVLSIICRNDGNFLTLCRLVALCESQQIVGRNLTGKCNFEYIDRCAIRLPHSAQSALISVYDHDSHSYVQLEYFLQSPKMTVKEKTSISSPSSMMQSFASINSRCS